MPDKEQYYVNSTQGVLAFVYGELPWQSKPWLSKLKDKEGYLYPGGLLTSSNERSCCNLTKTSFGVYQVNYNCTFCKHVKSLSGENAPIATLCSPTLVAQAVWMFTPDELLSLYIGGMTEGDVERSLGAVARNVDSVMAGYVDELAEDEDSIILPISPDTIVKAADSAFDMQVGLYDLTAAAAAGGGRQEALAVAYDTMPTFMHIMFSEAWLAAMLAGVMMAEPFIYTHYDINRCRRVNLLRAFIYPQNSMFDEAARKSAKKLHDYAVAIPNS